MVLIAFQYFIGAQTPNLDKILKEYYKANGLDKLKNVKTIFMSGTITRNDLMPVKISKMRPDKYRMDFELADLEAVQAYDGKNGWSVAPWTGNPKATVMDKETLKEIKVSADFEGILYNYKEKGHSAELIGKDSIDNEQAYKIKLTRNDGGIENYYITINDYKLVRRVSNRLIRGKEIEVINNYSNYTDIHGTKFPFVVETQIGGQRYSLIEYETIELNTDFDEKIFDMPAN
jgi:outer membrane lipoprotein-sorting protein